jgi:hypothetical protein
MHNSPELQGFILGLQKYLIFALVLLLPNLWQKIANMNCG